MPKERYTVVFYARLRYIERKSAIEGTTKPRWGYRYSPFTVTVYLFLTKIWLDYSRLPTKGIPVYFSPLYGTSNENQPLSAQQNREGDTDNSLFTVIVYLFLVKIPCISKLPKVYRWIFSASVRYVELKSAIEGTTKPRECPAGLTALYVLRRFISKRPEHLRAELMIFQFIRRLIAPPFNPACDVAEV